MAFNPKSGIEGSVKVGATSYAFGKWTLNMQAKALLTNNFTGGGNQTVVGGVKKADLTIEALTYDQGNMPFSAGTKYAFILGYDSVTSNTVTIFVETIEPTVDYDGLEAIKITGTSDGSFTPSIT